MGVTQREGGRGASFTSTKRGVGSEVVGMLKRGTKSFEVVLTHEPLFLFYPSAAD